MFLPASMLINPPDVLNKNAKAIETAIPDVTYGRKNTVCQNLRKLCLITKLIADEIKIEIAKLIGKANIA